MVDLDGQVAIVTGGGRGIGRAIALAYASAGADVAISAARNVEEAERVAAESEHLRGSVHAVRADVTVEDDVKRLLDATLALRGRIDVLVNNAARGMRFVNERFMTEPQPFWEAAPDPWRLVIETNIVGVFLVSRAVVPHMLAAGHGSIINVTINRATMVRRTEPRRSTFGTSRSLEHERDQPGNEPVEEGRLGEREPEPLDVGDLGSHLRLAGDRLDDRPEDHSDSDAGADRAEAAAQRDRDRAQSRLSGAGE